MSSYVGADLRRLVAARAEQLCEYCLIQEDDTNFGCQVDHVIAEKHNGLTVADNLAYACTFCNRYKGTDIASLSQLTKALTPLFDPRRDRWHEHFQLQGPRIVARSEIGEVTARLLRFNDLDRLTEREALARVGRYPSAAAARRMR